MTRPEEYIIILIIIFRNPNVYLSVFLINEYTFNIFFFFSAKLNSNLDICGALRGLVPFVQFKKREKHPLRSVIQLY